MYGRRLRVALAVATFASAARAEPTKRECIDANAQAQVELRASKLVSAKALLESCQANACPAQVRTDCAERLADLGARLPSVVLVARDGGGNDLASVRVTLDGSVVAERLDGRAVPLDPGEHTFVFETSGVAPVTQRVLLREREIGRRITAVLAPPPPPPPPRPVASGAQVGPPPAPDPGRTRRTVGLVTAGVGVAGLVAGGILGGLAWKRWSSAKDDCGAGCPATAPARDERRSAVTLATGSTVGFVAGGVLAACGVALYLTAPKAPRALAATLFPGGAGFVGHFE